MGKKLIRALGSLLFLGVIGGIVLVKYQDIFNLNSFQSILLVLILITVIFASVIVSEWLKKYLHWNESILEWISITILILLAAPVFIFFVL